MSDGYHILTERAEKVVKFRAPQGREVCLTREVYLRDDISCKSLACTQPGCVASNPVQTCVLFDNEFHCNCFRAQALNEDLSTYTTRMNVVTAQWYQNHLKDQVSVILVTENTELAGDVIAKSTRKDAISVINVHALLETYFPTLTEAKLLLESLEASVRSNKVAKECNASEKIEGKNLVAAPGEPYAPHLPESALLAGLRSGQFLRGILRVSRFRPRSEAVVTLTDASALKHQPELNAALGNRSEVAVHGMDNRNRAVDGDVVVIRLLPRVQWTQISNNISETESNSTEAAIASEGRSDSVDLVTSAASVSGLPPCGCVVGVANRRWRDYVCTLVPEQAPSKPEQPANETGWVLVTPWDRRIPRIRLHTTQASRLTRERIVVRIDSWDHSSTYPRGHLVQSLGPIGDLETETQTLLIEHNLAIRAFTDAQLTELAPFSAQRPWQVDPSEVARRRDLRDPALCGNPSAENFLIFSIDPEDCQDVDDALSVRWLGPTGHSDGGRMIELGVHIADVTFFVPPNGFVDAEAKRRSTSVYLADRRYDMLPGLLSGDLCSLWSGVDRYAVSVIWKINLDSLDVVDVWYGRTIIHSSYKLSYEVAQRIHDVVVKLSSDMQAASDNMEKEKMHVPDSEILLSQLGGFEAVGKMVSEFKQLTKNVVRSKLNDLASTLRLLSEVASTIRSRRVAQGGLELDSLEVSVRFEDSKNRTGNLEGLVPKEPLEMHSTIAELMIFANHWVARRCLSAFADRSCLRRHPPPRPEHFDELRLCAAARGINIDTESNRSLAQSLAAAGCSDDAEIKKVLVQLATRAMTNALYFSTGSENLTRDQFAHYGLALNLYTHFTSPIRRYADVVVHRVLLTALGDCRSAIETPLPASSSAKNTSDSLYTPEELSAMCKHMNEQHWAAQQVQRASLELFQALYFKRLSTDDPARVADAIICQLRGDNGFVVLVSRYGIRGSVCVKDHDGKVAWVQSNSAISLGDVKWISPAEGSFKVSRVYRNDEVKDCGWLEVRNLETDQSQCYKLFEHVKVSIHVNESAAHGLTLRLQLLSGPISVTPQAPCAIDQRQLKTNIIHSVQEGNAETRQKRFRAKDREGTAEVNDIEDENILTQPAGIDQDKVISSLHNPSSIYHIYLKRLREHTM